MTAAEHLKLAVDMFRGAEAFLDKGDTVQASEKLYKAVEEAIKALAEHFGLPEFKEAEAKGRWTTTLLDRAVNRLCVLLKEPQILGWWDTAWYLHVEGFHEARLDVDRVKMRLPYVERMLDLAKSRIC